VDKTEAESFKSTNSALEYLQAWSFAGYLIDRYGMKMYLQLPQNPNA
jgi:hypothetical protein